MYIILLPFLSLSHQIPTRLSNINYCFCHYWDDICDGFDLKARDSSHFLADSTRNSWSSGISLSFNFFSSVYIYGFSILINFMWSLWKVENLCSSMIMTLIYGSELFSEIGFGPCKCLNVYADWFWFFWGCWLDFAALEL